MTDDNQRRVLVLNGYGNNLGDQAIFAGFIHVFGTATDALELDVTLDQSFLYSFPFREETLRTLNQSYDLIVIGGGGIIYHRADDASTSGWGFDIPLELLSQLEVPFAIYSAAYNYLAYQEPHFPAHTAAHMRETVARAAHFSLRDEGSREAVKTNFGVEQELSIVPDCALHVEPTTVPLPFLTPSKKTVGVCLSLDKTQARFPEPFGENFERFVETLIATLRTLVEEDDVNVLLAPQLLTRHDHEVGQLLKAALPEGSTYLLHEQFPDLYRHAALENASVLAGIYRRLDVMLGQRPHSVILPFSVGTPVVSISSSDCNRWLQETFQAPAEMHLDLGKMEEDITLDRMVGALRAASVNRAEHSTRAFDRKAELVRLAREQTRGLAEKTLTPARSASQSTPVPV